MMQTPNLCLSLNWSFSLLDQVIYQYVLLDPAPGWFSSIMKFSHKWSTSNRLSWPSKLVNISDLPRTCRYSCCVLIYIWYQACARSSDQESSSADCAEDGSNWGRCQVRRNDDGKFPRRNWWCSRPEINVQSGTWSRSPAILGRTSSTPRRQKPPNYFGKPIR